MAKANHAHRHRRIARNGEGGWARGAGPDARPPPCWRRADRAVSTVIGTVLVLGITVVGITAVLFVGGPIVQRLQDQANLESMASQMASVRQAALKLSGTGSAAVPQLSVSAGALSLQPGDRLLVTVDMVANCDFRLTGWPGPATGWTGPVTQVRASGTAGCLVSNHANPSGNCPVGVCIQAFNGTKMAPSCGIAGTAPGTDRVQAFAAGTVTLNLDSADPRNGDWCFRLVNTAGTVLAAAYLLRQDALTWHGASPQGDQWSVMEGGALFTRDSSGDYLRAHPTINEAGFLPNDYVLRLPLVRATGSVLGFFASYSVAHAGTDPYVEMHFASAGRLVDAPQATRVRVDVYGPWAYMWSQALLVRDSQRNLGDRYVADTSGATCPDAALQPNRFYCVSYQLPGAAAMRAVVIQEVLLASVHV